MLPPLLHTVFDREFQFGRDAFTLQNPFFLVRLRLYDLNNKTLPVSLHLKRPPSPKCSPPCLRRKRQSSPPCPCLGPRPHPLTARRSISSPPEILAWPRS